jgi:hypothetical protein
MQRGDAVESDEFGLHGIGGALQLPQILQGGRIGHVKPACRGLLLTLICRHGMPSQPTP